MDIWRFFTGHTVSDQIERVFKVLGDNFFAKVAKLITDLIFK